MPESKHERFCRVAEKRVNNALHTIELLANLANRNVYDYSRHEVEGMFAAISGALENAKEAFRALPEKNRGSFSFKKLSKDQDNLGLSVSTNKMPYGRPARPADFSEE